MGNTSSCTCEDSTQVVRKRAPFSTGHVPSTAATVNAISPQAAIAGAENHPRVVAPDPWSKQLQGALQRRKDCILEAPLAEVGAAYEFAVSLRRDNPTVRMGIAVTHCGDHLCVKELFSRSLIEKYNKHASAVGGDVLEIGDLIFAVNNVAGTDKQLVEELLEQRAETVLCVKRAEPPSPVGCVKLPRRSTGMRTGSSSSTQSAKSLEN
mmetsp:Transcript_5280/g.12721  ORF Transcript_5280/g.12721 Transcript_5280/m.12721 type:complete len:209 (-) Transcript_5280:21-647(-)